MNELLSLNLPTDPRGTVATLLLALAILLALLSLIKPLAAQATRLCALFAVTALALYADHGATYVVAVIIVALSVSELGFLQNLAAFLGRGKESFDYQSAELSGEEKKSKFVDEAREMGLLRSPQASNGGGDSGSPEIEESMKHLENQLFDLYSESERLVFKDLQENTTEQIWRKRKLSDSRGKSIYLDAVVEHAGKPDTLVEVRYVPHETALARLQTKIDQISRLPLRYQFITGRDARLFLAIVVPGEKEVQKVLDVVASATEVDEGLVDYRVYNLEQLRQ